jgi:D-ribose pyranase
MKKSGIVNPQLLSAIGELGHMDLICVADAGLPIPESVTRIDLTLVLGFPPINQVLRALEAECVFEKKIFAQEASQKNSAFVADLDHIWPDLESEVISHEDLKRLLLKCRFVVRTGEVTPFANVILQSGVPF